MDLSPKSFDWCMRVYALFVDSDSFRGKQELCQRLESSLNPGSLVRRVVNDLFEEGILFYDRGLLKMNKGAFQEFIEETEQYMFINIYENDTHTIRY